jgi:hypothetical protein
MAKETPESIAAYADPRYVGAYAKLQEMKTRKLEAEGRIQAEFDRVNASRHGDRHLAAAERLLAGEEMEAPGPSLSIAKVQKECLVLETAVALQEARVREALQAASVEICVRVKPRYVDLVKRTYDAAAALVALAQEEERLVWELENGGVSFYGLTRIVWPMATAEILERFRREALDYYGLNLPG